MRDFYTGETSLLDVTTFRLNKAKAATLSAVIKYGVVPSVSTLKKYNIDVQHFEKLYGIWRNNNPNQEENKSKQHRLAILRGLVPPFSRVEKEPLVHIRDRIADLLTEVENLIEK